MSAGAKEALVPDAGKRAVLDRGLTSVDRVTANAKAMTEAATADHARVTSAVKADLKAGNWNRTEAVRQAKLLETLAKAAVPPKPLPGAAGPVISNALHKVGPILSGGAALGGAPHILNALGVGSSPALNATIGLGAAAAPYVYRGVRSAVSNPRQLINPLTGAAAGETAIAPRRVEVTDVPGLRK